MGLVLRRNLNRPLTAVEVDSNFEFLNITRWVQKSYLKDQFVYNLDPVSGNNILYVCLADHDTTAYTSGFAITGDVNGVLTNLWTQIGGAGGSGGTVKIETTTGTTIGIGIAAPVYSGTSYDPYGNPIKVFRRIQSLNTNLKVTYDGEAIYLNVTGTTSSLQPTGSHIYATNVTCNGGSNGSILIYATGGTNSRQFSINGTTWYPTTYTTDTSWLFNGLTAGTYTATVRDEVLGSVIAVPTTVSQPTLVSFSTSITPEVVSGITYNGAVTITPSGGNGAPYTINFNGAGYSSTTTYAGLTTGSYSVVIKDSAGCTRSGSVNITYTNRPLNFITTSTTNASCPGGNGTATINIQYGVPGTYQYRIDGGSFGSATSATSNVFTTTTGTHTLYAKDSTGKIVSGTTASITAPTAMTIATPTITNRTCGTGSASIIITVNNVNAASTQPTITFSNTTLNSSVGSGSWSNGGSGTWSYTLSSIPAGAYTSTAQVTNSCGEVLTSSSFTVTNTNAVTFSTGTGTAPTCVGSSWSYPISSIAGGISPYFYQVGGTSGAWSSAISTTSTTVSVTGSTLTGNRTTLIYFKDSSASPCISSPATVNNSAMRGITLTAGAVTNATCNGGTGSFVVNIAANSGLNNNTSAYTYKLINRTDNTTGSTITTSVTGSGSFTVPSLVAGKTYNVAVNVTSNTCVPTAFLGSDITITQPTQVTATLYDTTNPTTCSGSNGQIRITPSGGNGTYRYNINGGGYVTATLVSGRIEIGTLGAGSYTILVTDTTPCPTTAISLSTTLTGPSSPTLTGTYTQPLCNGTNTAKVLLVGSGGSGNYSFGVNAGTYPYTTGGTSYNLTGLSSLSGSVTFYIKDNVSNCTNTGTVSCTGQPTAIAITSVTKTDVSSSGAYDGTIIVSFTGGIGPYSVTAQRGTTGVTVSTSASPAVISGTAPTNGIYAGTYTISISTANGCTATTTPTITVGTAAAHDIMYYFRYMTNSPLNTSPNIYNSGSNNMCNSALTYQDSTYATVPFSTVINYYKTNLFGGGSIDLTTAGLTGTAWGGSGNPITFTFAGGSVAFNGVFGLLIPATYPILTNTHLYDVSSSISINAYAVYPNSVGLTSPTNVTISGVNYYLYLINSTTTTAATTKQFRIT